MIVKQIIVVKETRECEFRVALTPNEVALLVSQGHRVWVESQAGNGAGFLDRDYIKAGAEIFSLTSDGFPADSLILRVKRPSQERELLERTLFHENTAMIGFLDPLDPSIKDGDDHIAPWQTAGISTFSLELLNLSSDDRRNAQAAMSRIAGRLAFKDALKHYEGKEPLKVTILGTGPAAYNAAFEAKKEGVSVQVFGRKERYRPELESAGMHYHVLPEGVSHTKFIQAFLNQANIVIAAVRSLGKKSPVLIDESSLSVLPNNAVVIDLATGEGGNVVGSKSDQVVTMPNGIKVVNMSGYPKTEPRIASEEFSKCIYHLLEDVLSPSGEILLAHELLTSSWVTHQGQRNELF